MLIYNEATLSKTSKEYLNNPFTKEEIKRAIFDMWKVKAPGPEGFQAGFYKKYWDVVAKDTTNEILEIQNHNKPIDDINKTFIILISKVKNPPWKHHPI